VLARPRIAARLESLSSIRTQRWSDPPGQEPVAKAEPIQPDDGQCGGLWFVIVDGSTVISSSDTRVEPFCRRIAPSFGQTLPKLQNLKSMRPMI
jgi:hypothetical protein